MLIYDIEGETYHWKQWAHHNPIDADHFFTANPNYSYKAVKQLGYPSVGHLCHQQPVVTHTLKLDPQHLRQPQPGNESDDEYIDKPDDKFYK